MLEKNNSRNLEKQNFNSIDELYNSITKEGSLGLLALGYHGLILWRKKRIELGEVFPPKIEETGKRGAENSEEKDEEE